MPDSFIHLTRMQKVKAFTDAIAKLLAAVIVTLMAAALLVLLTRQTSNSRSTKDNFSDIRTILNQVERTNSFLVDCTTPGHVCYDTAVRNGKSRNVEIETVITNTIVATGSCRADHQDGSFAELKACVESRVP